MNLSCITSDHYLPMSVTSVDVVMRELYSAEFETKVNNIPVVFVDEYATIDVSIGDGVDRAWILPVFWLRESDKHVSNGDWVARISHILKHLFNML